MRKEVLAENKSKYLPGNVENLTLFRKFEDFILYFEPIVERFPHREHFALQADIKHCMHRIIELIIVTNKSSRKLEGWHKVDTELEILRFYIRLSYKKGSSYLSFHGYETAEKKINEIGKILGGLIKKGS
ncbi:MAG: diversity-generating retroelement protein Avd [Treponema sp.]|nr:diversity-generating retroelement protein Avd [Treponema sp.]